MLGSKKNVSFGFEGKIQLCVYYGSHILLSIPFPSVYIIGSNICKLASSSDKYPGTYGGYGGNIGDRTEIGHFGYIKSRIFILTLNMEVQKFRKFSANPSESIFKVNDSH